MTEPRRKVLIAFSNDERAAELRKVLGEAGYATTTAVTLKDVFARIRESADYDAILIRDEQGNPLGD